MSRGKDRSCLLRHTCLQSPDRLSQAAQKCGEMRSNERGCSWHRDRASGAAGAGGTCGHRRARNGAQGPQGPCGHGSGSRLLQNEAKLAIHGEKAPFTHMRLWEDINNSLSYIFLTAEKILGNSDEIRT